MAVPRSPPGWRPPRHGSTAPWLGLLDSPSTPHSTTGPNDGYKDLAEHYGGGPSSAAHDLPLQPVRLPVRTRSSISTFDANYRQPLYVRTSDLFGDTFDQSEHHVGCPLRLNPCPRRSHTTTQREHGQLAVQRACSKTLDTYLVRETEINEVAGDHKESRPRQDVRRYRPLPASSCAALPAGQTYGAVWNHDRFRHDCPVPEVPVAPTCKSSTLRGGRCHYSDEPGEHKLPSISNHPGDIANLKTRRQTTPIAGGYRAIPRRERSAGSFRYANTVYPGEFPDNFIITNPQFGAVNMQTKREATTITIRCRFEHFNPSDPWFKRPVPPIAGARTLESAGRLHEPCGSRPGLHDDQRQPGPLVPNEWYDRASHEGLDQPSTWVTD